MYHHMTEMEKIEHRAVIKYFVKKAISAKEINDMQEVLGDQTPSYATVKRWVGEFKLGRESMEDHSRSGRPTTSSSDETVEQITRIIMKDRHILVRQIASELDISKSTVADILSEVLGMHKVSMRWISRNLTPLQRSDRVACAEELLASY